MLDNELGNTYNMISIVNKSVTHRMAIATGKISVGPIAFNLIKENKLPKGDALLMAEIAGINAAKETPRLLSLCHLINLDNVVIYHQFEEDTNSIIFFSKVIASAKTGVEMEALAAVNAALLTVYDLTKMIEPNLELLDIYLVLKTGGKKKKWVSSKAIPKFVENILQQENEILDFSTLGNLLKINFALVTISDRVSGNIYENISGSYLRKSISDNQGNIKKEIVIKDDLDLIKKNIIDISLNADIDCIITTGGTGISPYDYSFEAMAAIADKEIKGFGEILRQNSSKYTKFAWLSLTSAWVLNSKLVIILPGSPSAIKENLNIIIELVPHAIKMLNNGNHD